MSCFGCACFTVSVLTSVARLLARRVSPRRYHKFQGAEVLKGGGTKRLGQARSGLPSVAAASRPASSITRFMRHTNKQTDRQTNEQTNRRTSPLRKAPTLRRGLNKIRPKGKSLSLWNFKMDRKRFWNHVFKFWIKLGQIPDHWVNKAVNSWLRHLANDDEARSEVCCAWH